MVDYMPDDHTPEQIEQLARSLAMSSAMTDTDRLTRGRAAPRAGEESTSNGAATGSRYGSHMTRFLLIAAPVLVGSLAGCSGGDPETRDATMAPATTSAPAATSAPATAAPTTTVVVTTSTAPPTTVVITGTAQSCEGFLSFIDDDGDGWGECAITIETAQQQYYVISGTVNGAVANLNLNRQADCDTYLAAIQTFGDELRAAQWPPEVQPQLDELVAANDYELFLRDDTCDYGTVARSQDAETRRSNAVFEFRTAIGSPTDL